MTKQCENLISYLAGELSEQESEMFKRHLHHCPSCSTEIPLLQEAWYALPYDLEEPTIPQTLKAEVMDFIFTERPQDQNKKVEKLYCLKMWFKQSFSPISTALVTVLLIGLIGLLWNNIELKNKISDTNGALSGTPQIIDTLTIQSERKSINANGIAYIIQEGKERELIIQFQNMPLLEGEEVYQVWLLKDGQRENAGTFRPNSDGKSVLSYRLPEQKRSFDDIGITLEPDSNSTKPRGQKMMGTL
ncbi:Putative zinc-finger [Bacillus sp. OV194]|nr:Putative zinc-finger [Bacillus sp. OV194]